MGRLHEERFNGSGRGGENEGEGYLGVEAIGDSKMGLVLKKKGENRRPVSVPASPRNTGKSRRAT